MLVEVLLALAGVLVTYYLIAKIINVRTAKKASHIPGVSLLSNMSLFLHPNLNFHFNSQLLIPILKESGLKQEGGGHLYRITVGDINYIIVTSPSVYHELTVSKYKNFDRPPDFTALTNFNPHTKEASSIFGSSHAPNTGAWKRIRGIADKGFTDDNLRKILERGTYAVVNTLMKKWETYENGQTVNATADMDAAVMDMIAQGGYGIKTDCINGKDGIFPQMVKNVFRTMLLLIVMRRNFVRFIPVTRYYYKFWVQWRKLLTGFVDTSRKRMIDQPNVAQGDVLSAMIKSSDISTEALSKEEMVKCLSDLTIAANDTTTATLQFCLYEISRRPEVQEKIKREIDAVYAKREDDVEISLPTFDELLSDMPYLKAVIYETLRVHPVAPYIVRYALKDIKLDNGIFIPKHTQLVTLFQIMHNDPNIWGADAIEYKPERFLNDAVFEKVPRSAYSPFAYGPRNCIGWRLAMIEIMLTLSSIIKNYEIKLQDGYELKKRVIITAHPIDPLMLVIKQRSKV
jgi:cytochrome P450/NADPH-cytochrome P450 reductase